MFVVLSKKLLSKTKNVTWVFFVLSSQNKESSNSGLRKLQNKVNQEKSESWISNRVKSYLLLLP